MSDLLERARVAHDAGRLDEAEASYRRLLALEVQHAGLFNNLGLVLVAQRRYADAVLQFEQSLRQRPRYVNTLVALSNALIFSNRPDEAIVRCGEILAIDSQHVEARHNLAVALRTLNRHREAIDELTALLAQDPADADAEFNLALCEFAIGDYASALRHHEARWRGSTPQAPLPLATIPLWQPGDDLGDAHAIVQAEQGLGDTLQFIRFVPELARRCASVHVQVQSALVDFVRRHLPGQHVGALGDEVPGEIPQRRIALMSLPLALQLTTESDWASSGAYLHADPARAAAWRSRLPDAALRVGVVWRGFPGHRNDHNRSLPLQTLAPWLGAMRASGTAVIALQKDVNDAEREWLRRYANVHVLGDALADFDETAAVLDSLDHVVAVDTAVAHLAGGMARPATILLPFSPDWRWQVDRDTTPIYPSVRLLRQRAIGDWNGAIHQLVVDAARWAPAPPW
ncbi:MAG: tetratricopeptide repeat protein [Casimicrobiaceae bacterium]